MNLAFLSNSLRTWGGAERLVMDLAIELQKKDGLNVYVIVANDFGGNEEELKSNGVTPVALNVDVSPLSVPNGVHNLSKIINRWDIDIVHSHLPFSHLLARMACIRHSTPNVSTYHNISDHKSLEKRLMERITKPFTNQIICVSNGVKESYPNNDSMSVIYNAIDIKTFSDQVSGSSPPELNTDLSKKTVFLNVARYKKQKQQEYILKALEELDTEELHVLLVGSGPRKETLEELVAEKGLSHCVTITGYVDEIEPYYKIADVFVSSSLNEGLPTTHIEAMAARLPVVSTEIPGVTEVVEHGETGLLYPVGDPEKLASAMQSIQEDIESFGEKGFEKAVSTFSLDEIARQNLSLYREIDSS